MASNKDRTLSSERNQSSLNQNTRRREMLDVVDAGCSFLRRHLMHRQAPAPTEIWPLKRIRIQGAEFVRLDVLQR
jgi:hypothetical protein